MNGPSEHFSSVSYWFSLFGTRLTGHGGGGGIRTHGAFIPHKFSRLGCYDRFSTPPWWKDLYLLKHLILDGAGLPVTARATRVSLKW